MKTLNDVAAHLYAALAAAEYMRWPQDRKAVKRRIRKAIRRLRRCPERGMVAGKEEG